MALDIVPTLRDLIRIASVNPMGRDVDGDIWYEHRLTDHLQKVITGLGLPWQRQTVAPGRDNLIARLDGEGPVLMLQVHQDTVPVDGMTVDPWGGVLRDGRVYGRGACDVKGGMACLLSVLSQWAEQRPAGIPTIVLAFTVNEEYGFTGAAHLRQLWNRGQSSLLPEPPAAILVAEPTQLNCVVAHKGILRWRCRTRGRAAHSCEPQRGVNAIYAMGRVLAAIEQYDREVIAAFEPHSLVGVPTLNVGRIDGGISINTVPDRCEIEIERRLLPDEEPEPVFREITQYISRQCDRELVVEHLPPDLASPGLTDRNNAELAQCLLDSASHLGVPSQRIGVPFGTDACQLAADGVPTVVFGPGSIDQAHTADEWIAVGQLETAVRILDRFVRDGLR